jgi:DNA-binding HxlR family transcriptional regulator
VQVSQSTPVRAPSPYAADCPTRAVLDRVGDRWTVLVLLLLERRTHRFTELQRSIEGISPKVLTQTLRALERDGLVTRVVHPEVPPRVEYSLTALGRTLVSAVAALDVWARSHIDEVEQARAAYDAR